MVYLQTDVELIQVGQSNRVAGDWFLWAFTLAAIVLKKKIGCVTTSFPCCAPSVISQRCQKRPGNESGDSSQRHCLQAQQLMAFPPANPQPAAKAKVQKTRSSAQHCKSQIQNSSARARRKIPYLHRIPPQQGQTVYTYKAILFCQA